MIITFALHPEYCETKEGEDCPCLCDNKDSPLDVTMCKYFKDKIGGICDGSKYHELRLDRCKEADGHKILP